MFLPPISLEYSGSAMKKPDNISAMVEIGNSGHDN